MDAAAISQAANALSRIDAFLHTANAQQAIDAESWVL